MKRFTTNNFYDLMNDNKLLLEIEPVKQLGVEIGCKGYVYNPESQVLAHIDSTKGRTNFVSINRQTEVEVKIIRNTDTMEVDSTHYVAVNALSTELPKMLTRLI